MISAFDTLVNTGHLRLSVIGIACALPPPFIFYDPNRDLGHESSQSV